MCSSVKAIWTLENRLGRSITSRARPIFCRSSVVRFRLAADKEKAMRITNPLPNVSIVEWLGFLGVTSIGTLLFASGLAGMIRYFGYCQ